MIRIKQRSRFDKARLLCVTMLTFLSSFPFSTFADRPLTVDDGFTLPQGAIEVEVGVRYTKLQPGHHYDVPLGITYGILPRLEAGIGFGGQIEEREEFGSKRRVRSGIGDLALGSKFKFLDSTNWWFDQAAAFTVKLPTADSDRGFGSGHTDYDLTWMATYPAADAVNIHINAGYSWIGGSRRNGNVDIVHYGVAADYAIIDSLQLVAEVFANTPKHGSKDTGVILNGGVRWFVAPGLVLDVAFGGGVRGDAPDWLATGGLNWLFGSK